MPITKGEDFNKTNFNNKLFGLYYYVLDYKHFNTSDTQKNSFIFSWCPTIQTLCYNPFLEFDDIAIIECDLDRDYFKIPTSYVLPKVYRTSFESVIKTLGKIDLREEYKELSNDVNFESKMLHYPYRYFLLSDGINSPMLIKPELIINGDTDIKVRFTLSQTSKYNIFLNNYTKDDGWGRLEGIVNNVPLLFPIGSNAYTNYFMTSGNTFNQLNTNAFLENDISLKQTTQALNMDMYQSIANNGASAIGNLLSGNFGGALSNVVNGGFSYANNQMSRQFNNENYSMKNYQIESMALAKKNDLLNTPRTMKTLGNDAIFSLENSNQCVTLYEFGLHYSYYNKIKDYFKRYGYKINRYMRPTISNRKYWNFVKTTNCNIDSTTIPHEHIQELEEIFNSGVTVWHIDNGAKIKNYYMDNIEV